VTFITTGGFGRQYVWNNLFVYTVNSTSVGLDESYNMFLGDTTAINGVVVLPSNAIASKCYTLKKIDSTNNILTVTTDDANCLVDGVSSLNITSVFDAMSCIMGGDGNYYTIVFGGGLISFDIFTETQVDISGVANIDGFYITFINTNYIPIMHSNTSSITIQYDETTKVQSSNNSLILYF